MSARAGAGDAPGSPRARALPVAMALREAGLAAFVMAVLAFPLIGRASCRERVSIDV